MAYERQTWETGTVIPESKLLHIENGIYDVTETADQNADDIKQNKEDLEKEIDELNSALAELPEVQSGTEIGITVSSSPTTGTITFPSAFSGAPNVTANCRHASPSTMYSVVITSKSRTQFSFSIYASNPSGQSPALEWIAVN